METIYVYSNLTGEQVANYTGKDNEKCENWAEDNWCSNDYHYSYIDTPVSNAIND